MTYKVEEREGKTIASWKDAEQRAFLALLQAEGQRTLLEIGAGTGVHEQPVREKIGILSFRLSENNQSPAETITGKYTR